MVICSSELREELDEKKRELEEAKQQLKDQGSMAVKSESNPILLNLGPASSEERPSHTYSMVCYSSGST